MPYLGPKRNAIPELYGTAFRLASGGVVVGGEGSGHRSGLVRRSGSGRRRAPTAPAARRRTAQRRLPTRSGEEGVRRVRRGRARQADRRSGERRGRNAVPALPAALGP